MLEAHEDESVPELPSAEGEAVTHEELCDRAKRWLGGSRRCEPVLSNCASCREIPDAIGWSSSYRWSGSTVIECKTSVSDFYADLRKAWRWRHPEQHWHLAPNRIRRKIAEEQGLVKERLPMMGNYRFYFCEPDVLPEKLVREKAPDHGLIYATTKRNVRIVIPAPLREDSTIDLYSEIRFLRFAIINRKQLFVTEESQGAKVSA